MHKLLTFTLLCTLSFSNPLDLPSKRNHSTLKQTHVDSTTLTYLIEEKKLLRDMYVVFSELFEEKLWVEMRQKEEKNLLFLEKVFRDEALLIPNTLSIVGYFENELLQENYDSLVLQGSSTPEEALDVCIMMKEIEIEYLKYHAQADNAIEVQFLLESQEDLTLLKNAYLQ
jgi:hypothetical protein